MGSSLNYAVIAGTTVVNTGNALVQGNLGIYPGVAVSGFPPGRVVRGSIVVNNSLVQSCLLTAYTDAISRKITSAIPNGNLNNLVLNAGIFACSSFGPLSLTGNLTLDGKGRSNSVFIFQTHSTLITGQFSTVTLINGAQACNVFWQVGTSATLGANSIFIGNILAYTSVTCSNKVSVQGRILAMNGAVTLNNDTISAPPCIESSYLLASDAEEPTQNNVGLIVGIVIGVTFFIALTAGVVYVYMRPSSAALTGNDGVFVPM